MWFLYKQREKAVFVQSKLEVLAWPPSAAAASSLRDDGERERERSGLGSTLTQDEFGLHEK